MTQRYLDAAIAVGARLAARAEATPLGPGWTGDAIVGQTEADARIVRGPVGPDLYGGVAGIGWFLAHLGAASGDRATMTLAREALAGAAAQALPAIGGGGAGLYSGHSGVALATSEGGAALGDADLQRLGDELAGALALHIDKQGPPGPLDLIEGSAGVLIALLSLRPRSQGRLEAACHRLARQLAAEVEGWVVSLQPPPLCGLGHGASGIAWALAEAGWALAEPAYRRAAGRALDYERAWFSAERCAWADLRGDDLSAPGWTCAWCHGALGVGALRARIWEVEADPGALAEASAALQAARSLVVQAAVSARGGEAPDVTLCHGLGGAIELILLAYEISGDAEHLRAARRVGDVCLQVFQRGGGRWTNGARGAEDVPGLFLGEASIGAIMLRLYDPRRLGSPALAGRPPLRT